MTLPQQDGLMASIRTRIARLRRHSEKPSLSRQIGLIGVLGWMIVVPMLLGLFLGRWLDRTMDTGALLTGALLLLGTVFGFWSAWKWMHQQ